MLCLIYHSNLTVQIQQFLAKLISPPDIVWKAPELESSQTLILQDKPRTTI